MNTELFARLFPLKINFVNGESPSPQKLNAIFNYVNAAFYVLESFLGNGMDYKYEGLEGRKMLFNLSSAIGPMGNLYKPLNKLTSLEHIYKHFIALHSKTGAAFTDGLHTEHASYTLGNEMAGEFLDVTKSFNIPINMQIKNAHQLRISFRGDCTLKIYSDNNIVLLNEFIDSSVDEKIGIYEKTFLLIGDKFIDYISIEVTEGSNIEIYSLSLSDVIEGMYSDGSIFNVSYAMPLDNGEENNEGFWKIARPCVHAKSSAVTKCLSATCEMCIGNTYDVYVDSIETKRGEPICAGDYLEQDVTNADMPMSSGEVSLSYTPVTYAANEPAQYTLQSCLLLRSKPYMIKFSPFAAHNNQPAGTILPQNGSIIYDITAQYNPLKYEIPIVSAGRSDIVYVADIKSELIPGEGLGLGTANYMILGGEVSVTQMISDLLKRLSENDTPKPAVYAD